MNTTSLLNDNRKLASQVNKLMALAESLLKENSELIGPHGQKTRIAQRINDLYCLLGSSPLFIKYGKKLVDEGNPEDVLDLIRTLIIALFHNTESLERQNEYLHEKVRELLRR